MTGILTIKLGALGDMVQALGPFAAIRAHHRGVPHTLLTTPAFAPLAEATGLFDQVRADGRPKGPLGAWRLARELGRTGFGRVYDLQTSSRSSLYFHLWPRPKPEWSGIARGCSHPHANPDRDAMHTIARQREQLATAGIGEVPDADLGFARADPAAFGIDGPFALLAPGGAAHRPAKRWTPQGFASLATHLARRGLRPVILGQGAAEAALAEAIRTAEPGALSLVGRTDLVAMAGLARACALALGNDTGPMHLAAAAGAPTIVLFGSESDPALCAPVGPAVRVVRAPVLSDLAIDVVKSAVDEGLSIASR